MNEALTLTVDPAWPWSVSPGGTLALAAVAVVLIALTVWTYRGVTRATPRRVATLLALRLAALLVVLLIVLRPAVASRDELKVPSTLLLALDLSESQTTQDETGGLARIEAMRRYLREAEPHLQKLRDEHQVTTLSFAFGDGVREYDPQAKADGKRTDFGEMLHELFERHGKEPHLRGLLVLSDGADNGTRHSPLGLAARWRGARCPVQTFALGQTTTVPNLRDVVVVNINPDPSPVAVKGKLTVKGLLDASGFVGQEVTVRLLMDDKEVAAKKEKLTRREGNEVVLTCDAPAEPREVKLTLRADPLRGETSVTNNEIGTYVTVLKEGLSVLYVEGKYRAWEPKYLRYALSADPRIRLYEVVRNTEVPGPGEADLFQFDRQHYDVILLGDLSAKRLAGGDPQLLTRLKELVAKGTGLMMIGGRETFGEGDWRGTPLEDLLPVQLDEGGELPEPVRIAPTREGLQHFMLRLADSEATNKALWEKLPALGPVSRLGTVKQGATLFANTNGGRPLLVGQQIGGRVLAFGGDTTWHWANTPENMKLHHRFWQQVILWLAQQDQADGSVRVIPDVRRLPAGSKLGFTAELRTSAGVRVPDAQFEVKVIAPNGVETSVPTSREQKEERGTFFKTDQSGEYQLVAKAWGKATDGSALGSKESPLTTTRPVRFLVYQDEAERLRPAADHEFLGKLANAGGGKFHRAEEFAPFLEKLGAQPLPQNKPKVKVWPDWKRLPATRSAGDQLASLTGSGLLPVLLLFVTLLSTEWLLRRRWGLV